MSSLEDRVDALESRVQEDVHVIKAAQEAHALGLQLVYADTQAVRADVGELRRDLNGLAAKVDGFQDENRARFDAIETTLAEIVRRLPEPPA